MDAEEVDLKAGVKTDVMELQAGYTPAKQLTGKPLYVVDDGQYVTVVMAGALVVDVVDVVDVVEVMDHVEEVEEVEVVVVESEVVDVVDESVDVVDVDEVEESEVVDVVESDDVDEVDEVGFDVVEARGQRFELDGAVKCH